MQRGPTTRTMDKYHKTSATASSTDARDRGKTWTHGETDAMIRLWASEDVQQQLRSTLRNNHVFRVISKRLSSMGYARTPDQCRTKVKSLKSTYRRLKDLNNAKKAQRVFCFYELFDRTMNKQRSTMTAVKTETTEATTTTTTLLHHPHHNQHHHNHHHHDETSPSDGMWPYDNSNGLAGSVDDGGGVGGDDDDEEDDDEATVDDNNSLLDTLPLAVQLGHSSDDDDVIDDGGGGELPLDRDAVVDEDDDDDVNRHHRLLHDLNDSPLDGRDLLHHQPPSTSMPPPTSSSSSSSKQRRRTQLSRTAAAAQNHHEELAERLVQHFLRAEEKIFARYEKLEERRMTFELDLANRQQREDAERFRQLFQLLSNPPPGASHVVAASQPVQPPRVVYMQEVGPPTWTN